MARVDSISDRVLRVQPVLWPTADMAASVQFREDVSPLVAICSLNPKP